ncbi:uncharacterized protein si:ch1073-126c3.2 [Cebidichthys violaceus]|uniref:uncharacterized protein si:ch1073-126c3.2 n=1 Tax=Cebidichthys violaceus TaxID=271503 RepID=UPI0035CBBC4A
MAVRGTLMLLCSLAVLSSTADQDETLLQNCTSQTQLLKRLSAVLKGEAECGGSQPSEWSPQQTAALLLSMRNVTEALHRHQLKECHGAEPKRCPEAEVPRGGGLACVTVANKRYCKPLCGHGYDFAFIRRSRLYDECSEQTGYRWQTQYVGGNKLAVCNEASIQVSGAKTAYFPEGRDCLASKLQSDAVVDVFTSELRDGGVQGEPHSACLVCG